MDESQHVRDLDLVGFLHDDREERLQVRGGGQDRVRPAPRRDKNQIPVQDRMPQLRQLEGTLMSRQNPPIEGHGNRFLSGATTRPNDEPTQA